MRINWIAAGVGLVISLVWIVPGYASTEASSNVQVEVKAKKTHSSKHRRGERHHRKAAAHAEAVPRELKLNSSSALVFDEQDGKLIYSKNSDVTSSIASITKLMTAMVVLDAQLPMDEQITIVDQDVDTLRNSGSRLAVGTTLPRQDMLRLALMSSENRAAAALARTYPGGTSAFVANMNNKAATLGMARSHFVDSTGLHSENVSTAEDLVKMVQAGIGYDQIREFTTTASHDFAMPGRRHSVEFHNTNALVRAKQWDIGLSKTGFINEAGRCLVMQAKIASRSVIIVLLDSWGKYTRIGDANRIKKWVEHSKGRKVVRNAVVSRDV